jgi:hypothetical protein
MIGVEQGPESAEKVRAQQQELIAAGVAHLYVTWTIGLYITLAGGILGSVGGLLAIRDRPNTAALPAVPA